jgi:hypothetical protein
MFKSKSKNNKRVVDLDVNKNRKFVYHSQIKSAERQSSDRLLEENRAKTRNKSFLRQSPTIISFLVILIVIFYISTLNSNPEIDIVNSPSTVKYLHSPSQYKHTIAGILNSSILNRSKFTVDSNSIARQIESDYPELDSATVIIPITGHSLEVVLKASTPVINLENSTGYYLLNDNGIAILKFDSLEQMESTKLVTLNDQSNSPVHLGSSFISSNTVSFIKSIIYQYTKKGLSVQVMTLPDSPYELDVQSRGQTYIVKYNLLDDVNYQIGTYFTIINYIKANNQSTPSQYIDLRVPGKAFYK